MLNIFFIDLFINIGNELPKGLHWKDSDAIRAADTLPPEGGFQGPSGVLIKWTGFFFPHGKPR